MSSTKAHIVSSIGTFPLLGTEPVVWVQTEGVEPYEGRFTMVPAHALALLNKDPKTPVSLEIEANGLMRAVKNLWVETVKPGHDPFHSVLVLSDRRRFFKYGIVVGRYNIKRDIGTRRVESHTVEELKEVVPDIWYKAFSLKNPKAFPASVTDKWNALEMIQDVFKKALRSEADYTGVDVNTLATKVKYEDVTKLSLGAAVEDLHIVDKANFALQRALSYFPELGLTVDDDGSFAVYSRVSGKERKLIQSLGPEIVAGGHIAVVDNKNSAPGTIEVYWPYGVEVRFDYKEPTEGATTPQRVDERDMTNVAQVPDFNLSIGGVKVTMGTWRNLLFDLLTAWGSPPKIGGDRLLLKTIRRAMAGYVDLWGPLRLFGATQPNADWVGRIGAIQQHFRLTFQLPPRWVDRTLSIRAYRVGVADAVNQVRASSEVFCDWHKMGTMRSFFKNKADGQSWAFAMNENGSPQGATAGWPSNMSPKKFNGTEHPAPAAVTVVDADQGIIHVDFKTDMFKVFEQVGPGKITNTPSSNWGNQSPSAPLAFDVLFKGQDLPEYDADFRFTVILTLQPASPNDLKQFYKVVVKPEDVSEFFPGAAKEWLSKASGPTWQALVNPGLDGAEAMIRWHDDRWADIEKIFGVQDGEPDLKNLIVNRNTDKVRPDKSLVAPNIDTLSRALAARVWATYATRLQGSMTGHMKPGLNLRGWASGLSTVVQTRGQAVMTVTLPEAIPEFPYTHLLDGATRQLIFREALPRQ